jgi:hypothetical protein
MFGVLLRPITFGIIAITPGWLRTHAAPRAHRPTDRGCDRRGLRSMWRLGMAGNTWNAQ